MIREACFWLKGCWFEPPTSKVPPPRTAPWALSNSCLLLCHIRVKCRGCILSCAVVCLSLCLNPNLDRKLHDRQSLSFSMGLISSFKWTHLLSAKERTWFLCWINKSSSSCCKRELFFYFFYNKQSAIEINWHWVKTVCCFSLLNF